METKRQTFIISEDNIELIRQVSFYENKKKQDVVDEALTEYFRTHYPELYKKVKGGE